MTTPGSLDQLRSALAAGFIDQATFETAAAAIAVRAEAGAAIAQGRGATAVAGGGVAIGRDNHGVVNLGVWIERGSAPGASADDLRRAYLARLLQREDQLPLFAGDGGAPVQLSSVYTALLTLQEDDAAPQANLGFGRQRRRSAVEMLDAEPRLVLLGGPGSGKSSFVAYAALAMAGELLGQVQANLALLTAPLPPDDDDEARFTGKRHQPEPQPWRHGALLPVQVVLRDLAAQLPPPGHEVGAEAVWSYLESRLQPCALAAFLPHLRDELLRDGALVLFDGLDEVPEALQRRDQIRRVVEDFAATHSKCRCLVTSRTYAYQRQDWKLRGFAVAELAPFSAAQIERFVRAWAGHMVQLERLTESDATARAERLIHDVRVNPRLRDLAERPLLLTLIAQLHTERGGSLPERREVLYDRAVEMLLNQWEGMKVRTLPDGRKVVEPSLTEWLESSRDAIRRQLERLAFEAHRDQPQLSGTADIRESQLLAALAAASPNPDAKLLQLQIYLRDRAGILAAHGVGLLQFPHRSFQEYLAACYLTDHEFPEQVATLARADPNRWREVALLAGAKAARGSAVNVWALAEELCPSPPEPATEEALWGALLAGQVLAESAALDAVPRRNQEAFERVRGAQLTLLRGGTLPAVERARAGRTLARLGDPRPEVMTLDGMQFCLVPAGPFQMGSERGFDDEKPLHRVELPKPYFIGRYPVTVAQWREYIESTGAAATDHRALDRGTNEPVCQVSWGDAIGFCRFLGERWRNRMPQGHVVLLPSEAEWEKAARGGFGIPAQPVIGTVDEASRLLGMPVPLVDNPMPEREYPWGDPFEADFCNAAMNVGEPSAAGCFLAGTSPVGCEEMSGNLWEWTRSVDGPAYPYEPDDPARERVAAGDNDARLVRGGSWAFTLDRARCAYRGWGRPDDRNVNLGFRVVLRSSPVS